MKIAIVGLGLIGGSLAKAIKKNTEHSCFALDIDRAAIAGAVAQEAIDGEITADELHSCDVVMVCLHPAQTINFIIENKSKFKKGGIVIDSCGVKAAIVNAVEKPLADEGVYFLGCHPMAGREFSGFAYSVDNLFEKASFIMTPSDELPVRIVREVSQLAYEIGFARVVTSTVEEHDRIIAFTSQLAHVVSSAYVKSPSLLKQSGFSAGSFKDMTRVAKLNENMWTELFMMNRQPLIDEIDCIIARLTEYRDAISAEDADGLRELLKTGRELKELSNNS
ncbi:MAG: prephenate dehydrogenase [Ruminococcus sp.]|uniref:prephenate dehydrogenase n=1 Tax=Ruminococcus sp. TaxID=41978 RepID=UPI0025F70ADD|nr:prephenate dehydrogenase [Ruminococcus sp.]MBR0530460.1 prephenate dehydrogenase [Ruminococcus sp.]